jgi:lysozyme|tara:strand:+ start:166 stop:609 length:444 start_codon:yes stop_codon:yes gene_type:complete
MKISEEGKALIKKFEGCELKAYRCPAGKLTIGYGHVKNVKEGDEWTQEKAEQMLNKELKEYEGYINDYVQAPLLQCQFDALVAWIYNLGPTNFRTSTLRKKLEPETMDEVPREIRRWNKANGKVLDGLVRRREAEALLFQGKEWTEV